MSASGERRVHLHADDHPVTLAVLAAVFDGRHQAGSARAIGYEPTGTGVWVDWDRLEDRCWSSTERAAVVVAQGIAGAEGQGGWPPRLQRALVDAIGAL